MVQNNQGSGQQANNEHCGRWVEQKKVLTIMIKWKYDQFSVLYLVGWALPKVGILSERMEIARYLPRPYDLGSIPGIYFYFQQFR